MEKYLFYYTDQSGDKSTTGNSFDVRSVLRSIQENDTLLIFLKHSTERHIPFKFDKAGQPSEIRKVEMWEQVALTVPEEIEAFIQLTKIN